MNMLKANKVGFSKGWRKANEDQKKALMEGLKKIFEVTTSQAVYSRIRGDVDIKRLQITPIEKLFSRHGISDIWGEKKSKKITASAK